jgi:hypothetical protein
MIFDSAKKMRVLFQKHVTCQSPRELPRKSGLGRRFGLHVGRSSPASRASAASAASARMPRTPGRLQHVITQLCLQQHFVFSS